MESFYHAYEAYERRVIRGEFAGPALKNQPTHPFPYFEPILARLGDFLVRTGMRLKYRYAAGKPMAWSPMTRSKQ